MWLPLGMSHKLEVSRWEPAKAVWEVGGCRQAEGRVEPTQEVQEATPPTPRPAPRAGACPAPSPPSVRGGGALTCFKDSGPSLPLHKKCCFVSLFWTQIEQNPGQKGLMPGDKRSLAVTVGRYLGGSWNELSASSSFFFFFKF